MSHPDVGAPLPPVEALKFRLQDELRNFPRSVQEQWTYDNRNTSAHACLRDALALIESIQSPRTTRAESILAAKVEELSNLYREAVAAIPSPQTWQPPKNLNVIERRWEDNDGDYGSVRYQQAVKDIHWLLKLIHELPVAAPRGGPAPQE